MIDKSQDSPEGDRIAKVLARAGVCSRRDAERMIAEGRVAVDGKRLATPAFKVPAGAKITVDGKPIKEPERARLWRYHKPKGVVTTHRDEKGRPTVFERLPADMPRVISIGRLDFNSEGLLLLTNDGELARRLELPANGWLRRYRVRVFGKLTQEDLDRLKRGVEIDGVKYGPVEATLDRQQGGNAWATVALKEGKNREVRRLMEHIGVQVNRLIRVSFGPFHLGQLKEGQVDEIPSKVFREQLGIKKGAGWA
jgi:23S rRNA pseudouridine2605 synthase